jgi:uncharacterized membrane protein
MWHFARNGKTQGPMEKLELVERAHRGDFGPDDLVWHPDFGSEWRAARTVEGLFVLPDEPVGAAAGTGGMTENRDLTRRAREALAGHWGLAIGFTILLQMVMFAIVMMASLLELVIPLASTIVQLAIAAPLSVGGLIFSLALSRGREAGLGMMFSGFRSWWPAVGANLMMVLLIVAWVLLVMLPFGIVAAVMVATHNFRPDAPLTIALVAGAGLTYVVTIFVLSFRYAMTFFAIADDPSCGPVEAIRRSVRLMYGHKAKLFFLSLRFIGWMFLGLLTCCIGYLWLMPYMAVSMAAFYDDLKRPGD